MYPDKYSSWSDWESQIVYRGKKLSRLGGWAYQGDLGWAGHPTSSQANFLFLM